MSSSPESAQARTSFTLTLTCYRCGQPGFSVWEENTGPFVRGTPLTLISLSEGFYERLARKHPHVIELVCHRCEAVQREMAVGPRAGR